MREVRSAHICVKLCVVLTETEALKERQKFKNARKRIRRDEEEAEEGEPYSRGDDEIPIKKIMRIRSNLKAIL